MSVVFYSSFPTWWVGFKYHPHTPPKTKNILEKEPNEYFVAEGTQSDLIISPSTYLSNVVWRI